MLDIWVMIYPEVLQLEELAGLVLFYREFESLIVIQLISAILPVQMWAKETAFCKSISY